MNRESLEAALDREISEVDRLTERVEHLSDQYWRYFDEANRLEQLCAALIERNALLEDMSCHCRSQVRVHGSITR